MQLFSNLLFWGDFHPVKICFDDEIKDFPGVVADTSAKRASLIVTVPPHSASDTVCSVPTWHASEVWQAFKCFPGYT